KLAPKTVSINGSEVQVSRLSDYFDALEKSGVAVNVATYVGLENIWGGVMGDSFEHPSQGQIEEMKTILDAALRDGAFGLSTMLAAPQEMVATTDDLVELCKVVRRRGGIFTSHIRHEGIGVFPAIREAIAVGERSGVPVDIIHIKIADQALWGHMPE